MRVKVTLKSFPINIQELDSKLALALSQHAADYASIFPPTCGLDIKFQDFAFRREGYKINRTLFNEGSIHIAATSD
jgi:hypothetical protein